MKSISTKGSNHKDKHKDGDGGSNKRICISMELNDRPNLMNYWLIEQTSWSTGQTSSLSGLTRPSNMVREFLCRVRKSHGQFSPNFLKILVSC